MQILRELCMQILLSIADPAVLLQVPSKADPGASVRQTFSDALAARALPWAGHLTNVSSLGWQPVTPGPGNPSAPPPLFLGGPCGAGPSQKPLHALVIRAFHGEALVPRQCAAGPMTNIGSPPSVQHLGVTCPPPHAISPCTASRSSVHASTDATERVLSITRSYFECCPCAINPRLGSWGSIPA